MSFVKSFLFDPLKYRSLALAKFRLFQLLHVRTNGAFDRFYQRWSAWIRPSVVLPYSKRLGEVEIESVMQELRIEGCKILPFRLTADELFEIKTYAFSVPAYAVALSERILIDPANIPQEHGRYYWPMHQLVECQAVKNLLSDAIFHSIAQQYLGARPVLAHVTLWLDPVYDGYYDPHVYHYDNDGPGFLKFFFYITDVTEETGAHRYIRRSHSHSKPLQFKTSRRYDAAELLSHYGVDKEVVFEGEAGTILAEDTAGFHRGTTLKSGYRLLMQFEYSLIDIPHEEDLAGQTCPVCFPELNAGIARIARKFYRK